MRFDWWTFGFQLVNLAVLLWLLGHFLFRPIVRMIGEREARIAESMEAADRAKQAAEEARTAATAERARHAAERATILENARAEADRQKAALIEHARSEAAGILREARSEARRIGEDGHRRQLHQAGELAVSIAHRLLANLPEDARVAGYARRLADALARLDPERRQAITADGAALSIVAPRPLTEDEEAGAREAVASALPDPPALSVVVEPELIAGLELRSPHTVVRNSLRADLERIAEALASDERH